MHTHTHTIPSFPRIEPVSCYQLVSARVQQSLPTTFTPTRTPDAECYDALTNTLPAPVRYINAFECHPVTISVLLRPLFRVAHPFREPTAMWKMRIFLLFRRVTAAASWTVGVPTSLCSCVFRAEHARIFYSTNERRAFFGTAQNCERVV